VGRRRKSFYDFPLSWDWQSLFNREGFGIHHRNPDDIIAQKDANVKPADP
jgi:hypothetical protein